MSSTAMAALVGAMAISYAYGILPYGKRARQKRPSATPRSPAKIRYSRYKHGGLDEMRAQL